MSSAHFLINTLFDLYLMVVLLRIWLQMARADFYNPVSQFVIKATHPIVAPMRRVLPSIGSVDTATLVLALLVAALKVAALSALSGAPLNPAVIALGSVMVVLKEAFQLVFWVLVIRALLSWVSQGHNPMELVMHQLTEPMLAPIRRIIPPMGGFDLSILVLLIALQFFQLAITDVFL